MRDGLATPADRSGLRLHRALPEPRAHIPRWVEEGRVKTLIGSSLRLAGLARPALAAQARGTGPRLTIQRVARHACA
jgi:hypothetical protein